MGGRAAVSAAGHLQRRAVSSYATRRLKPARDQGRASHGEQPPAPNELRAYSLGRIKSRPLRARGIGGLAFNRMAGRRRLRDPRGVAVQRSPPVKNEITLPNAATLLAATHGAAASNAIRHRAAYSRLEPGTGATRNRIRRAIPRACRWVQRPCKHDQQSAHAVAGFCDRQGSRTAPDSAYDRRQPAAILGTE